MRNCWGIRWHFSHSIIGWCNCIIWPILIRIVWTISQRFVRLIRNRIKWPIHDRIVRTIPIQIVRSIPNRSIPNRSITPIPIITIRGVGWFRISVSVAEVWIRRMANSIESKRGDSFRFSWTPSVCVGLSGGVVIVSRCWSPLIGPVQTTWPVRRTRSNRL